jgi:hypothetical protein
LRLSSDALTKAEASQGSVSRAQAPRTEAASYICIDPTQEPEAEEIGPKPIRKQPSILNLVFSKAVAHDGQLGVDMTRSPIPPKSPLLNDSMRASGPNFGASRQCAYFRKAAAGGRS